MTREQQYWEDTQEALSRIFDRCEEIDPQSGYEMLEDIQFIRGFINKCKPRTEKQEPKMGWIPVSEKLPNDRDWYLGIFKEPDTGWINPLPFICDYVGRETKATTKEYWILRGFTDRDEHIDYYFNLECIAWMPLPKPYEPQESEDKE